MKSPISRFESVRLMNSCRVSPSRRRAPRAERAVDLRVEDHAARRGERSARRSSGTRSAPGAELCSGLERELDLLLASAKRFGRGVELLGRRSRVEVDRRSRSGSSRRAPCPASASRAARPCAGERMLFDESIRMRASACASAESGRWTAIWSPSKSALKAWQTSGCTWIALPSTSTGSNAWMPRRCSVGARFSSTGCSAMTSSSTSQTSGPSSRRTSSPP